MDGNVIEGFICPLCFKDFKTALKLNNHFQDHSQNDQKRFRSVKGIYEKFRKKVTGTELGQNQLENEQAEISSRIPGYAASLAESPKNLLFKSHTDRFKAIRDLRNERYASQTNTLLIRLGKLLQQLPTDPIRRKAYEQDIVPWLDDKDVSLCPSCAKAFNLLKRKHHCRLCGSVMCKNCTFLLSLEEAHKMVGSTPKNSSAAANFSPRPKLQSVEAIQAVLAIDSSVINNDFRICEHCHLLLHSREKMRQNRNEHPIISQFYERLTDAMKSCDNSLASYFTVYSSLCAGETKYTLVEATNLRIELLRFADTIDSISKKIVVLGQNTDSPPQGTNLKLQQSIRNAAAIYLKKNVVSLPSLPTEEELLQYQERRRIEIERKIDEERRRETEEERRVGQDLRVQSKQYSSVSDTQSPIVQSTSGKVTVDEGWTPRVKQAIISDDPLLEQIGILHGFIEQAERAGKEDECAALRRNLKELEEALDMREAAAADL